MQLSGRTCQGTMRIRLALGACPGLRLQRMRLVPINVGVDAPVYVWLYAMGIRNRSSLANVICTIGGVNVPVTYAGPQNQ